jgi:outer membrane receptor protein involved in Fe transport
VQEGSTGLYAQNTTRWTDWLRTIAGVREDWFSANVASETPENSGRARASIASPKAGLVLGPFYRSEIFLNYGQGFHSNDVRGVTVKVDPNDKVTPLEPVPFLVRAKGAEVGVRTKAIEGRDRAVALFVLDYASELLFVGDAGTTGRAGRAAASASSGTATSRCHGCRSTSTSPIRTRGSPMSIPPAISSRARPRSLPPWEWNGARRPAGSAPPNCAISARAR